MNNTNELYNIHVYPAKADNANPRKSTHLLHLNSRKASYCTDILYVGILL